MRTPSTVLGAALALAVLTLPSAGAAQVSCANPNNLCVGNPCTIGEIEVISPCTVDFGARRVIITRTFTVPNNGSVSLTAQDFEVRGKILARHTSFFAGNGADVTLTATKTLQVFSRIDASGRYKTGTIKLSSGTGMLLRGGITSSARGSSPLASGGTIDISAGGPLTATNRGKIRAKGKGTPGGNVSVVATSMTLDGRIDARGGTGGDIEVSTTSGVMAINDKLEVDGADGTGGTITVSGAAGVTTQRKLDADGATTGGTIDVSGLVVNVNGNLQARGNGSSGTGGAVTVTGQFVAVRNVRLRGGASAGSFTATATTGSLTMNGQVDMRAINGVGGTMELSAAGQLKVLRKARADGEVLGGTITLESTGDAVIVTDRLSVDSSNGAGGSVMVSASKDVTLDGGVDAAGETGGTVVASAGEDLTALGPFDADSGGCIALSAVGSLDLVAAVLDPANSPSCP